MKVLDQNQLFKNISLEHRILLSACSPIGFYASSLDYSEIKNINWDTLISLCERHRLLPLFYRNFLKQSLCDNQNVPEILKEKANIQTQQALTLTGEGLRINAFLKNHGVKVIFLKGTFLSYKLYGDYGIRPSKDIDILIDYVSIDFVNNIFLGNGYKRIYPDFDLSTKQRKFYEKHKNQYAYKNINNGVVVELHWRLFSSDQMLCIPFDDLYDNSDRISINNHTISTLNSTHNFLFLCFHGAVHQWYRLIWLRDIAQILSKEPGLCLAALKNKDYASERVVEQAIRLSNIFFNVPLIDMNAPPKKLIISIVNSSVKAITDSPEIMNSKKIERFRMPVYKMKLKKGLYYKLDCWTILHPNFQEWKTIKISDKLFFLYFFIRPFLWFKRIYLKGKN